jgi:hypothetical protein
MIIYLRQPTYRMIAIKPANPTNVHTAITELMTASLSVYSYSRSRPSRQTFGAIVEMVLVTV